MPRNLRLWTIGIALWSGAAVHAQGPMPSPYPPPGYGYPAYPMPASYGRPMMPRYGASDPMPSQPYYVTDMGPGKTLPESVPTKPAPAPAPVPEAPPPGEPITIYQGPSACRPLETEPVAVYEGNRYFAEMKLDNTCAWVQANYIHWWIQRPTAATPLVTSGTSTVLGGEIGPREFSGVQVQAGLWLDPQHINSIEIMGQWLGKSSMQYPISSDAAGNPALSIPTTGAAIPVAVPGVLAGSARFDNIMSFHGAEIDYTQNMIRINGWTFDTFVGGRYLYMNDTLTINQTRTALTGTALTFGGAAAPTGSSVQIYDSFNANNRFFGGTLGARLHWTYCRFDMGVSAKVALGATQYTTIVDGSSTLSSPAAGPSTLVGDTFAQPSNIGRHTDSQFTAIPEVETVVSYQLTPSLRILGGYSFLYWNRVQRAVDQLDRTIDPAQSPTNPAFTGATTGNPLFPSLRTGLLIQAVNVGIEWKF